MANEQELLSEIENILGIAITVMDGSRILAKLKAMGYEQVWVKCPDCGGTKRIFRLPVTALGETSNEFPCPTCKGTGRITNKER